MVDEAFYQTMRNALLAIGLALPRMLVVFLLLPIFSKQLIPGLLRSAVATALVMPAAVMLFPMVQAASPADLDGARILGILVKESVAGLVLGYLLALPFWAMEAVGFLIDNQRGASVAATINPLTGHDTSPLGILFNQAFIVFFFAAGGFSLFLDVVYQSYQMWPVLGWTPSFDSAMPAAALGILDSLVRMALLLAAPVMIAMFLAEIGLGFVSRFAPQLNVFVLAMPIKSALAMLMLAVYAATLFDYALDRIRAMPQTLPTAQSVLGR